jgi:hypothetical protein
LVVAPSPQLIPALRQVNGQIDRELQIGETREKIRFTSKRVKTENGSYYQLTKESWIDEMMKEYDRWLKNQDPKTIPT